MFVESLFFGVCFYLLPYCTSDMLVEVKGCSHKIRHQFLLLVASRELSWRRLDGLEDKCSMYARPVFNCLLVS